MLPVCLVNPPYASTSHDTTPSLSREESGKRIPHYLHRRTCMAVRHARHDSNWIDRGRQGASFASCPPSSCSLSRISGWHRFVSGNSCRCVRGSTFNGTKVRLYHGCLPARCVQLDDTYTVSFAKAGVGHHGRGGWRGTQARIVAQASLIHRVGGKPRGHLVLQRCVQSLLEL